jgi:trimeric autotransporter adhesin
MNTRLALALSGAVFAVLVLAGTSGASHLGSLELGHVNTSTAQTTLTANLGTPVLKVVNQGAAAALRGDAQTGIGVNGVSVSGTGQQGVSQTGIGLLGAHSDPTGANPGVQGQTASTDPGGAGVVGRNTGGGPGLRAIVSVGAPPLAVNSSVIVANLNADLLDGRNSDALPYWKLGGNAGTTPGVDFVGTTDNNTFEVRVNGLRAFRFEPNADSPNVIGGRVNLTSGGAVGATIGGGGQAGFPNTVSGSYGTVGGGSNNRVGFAATVGGGDSNVASSNMATIAGGQLHQASAFNTTIGGGYHNIASGLLGTIPGGADNLAQGIRSFAAGNRAKATDNGSFVWGDSKDFDIASNAVDSFTARTTGGARFVSAIDAAGTPTAGVTLASGGGSWASISDRNAKSNFTAVNKRSLLRRLMRIPIERWSYKAQGPSIVHMGPTAQDFSRAFGLGEDNRHITTVDADGVALAAIQGLYRQNQLLRARLAKLERSVALLSRR